MTEVHGLDYSTLTPGIRETVRWLRSLNFHTTDSGDGVTNVAAGMEGALDVPHVHALVHHENMKDEAYRLAREVQLRGLVLEPGMIDLRFDPCDRVALLSLYGVNDEALAKAAR